MQSSFCIAHQNPCISITSLYMQYHMPVGAYHHSPSFHPCISVHFIPQFLHVKLPVLHISPSFLQNCSTIPAYYMNIADQAYYTITLENFETVPAYYIHHCSQILQYTTSCMLHYCTVPAISLDILPIRDYIVVHQFLQCTLQLLLRIPQRFTTECTYICLQKCLKSCDNQHVRTITNICISNPNHKSLFINVTCHVRNEALLSMLLVIMKSIFQLVKYLSFRLDDYKSLENSQDQVSGTFRFWQCTWFHARTPQLGEGKWPPC